jgi:hypothetical protein
MWHGAQCYVLQEECPTRKTKLLKTKLKVYPLSLREVENICLGFIHLFQFSWNLGQLLTVFQCHCAIFIHAYILTLLGGSVIKLPQIFIRYATSMNAIIPFEFSSIFTYSLYAFTWNWGQFLHFIQLGN